MDSSIVTARLLRVADPLRLTRAAGSWSPAMLVIPRGTEPHEPHLVVVSDPYRTRDPGDTDVRAVDVHVVARADQRFRRRDAAVLVFPAATPVVFDRYPGCEVAIGRCRGGWLARLRDGRAVAVKGPHAAYGSMLHCWLAAGMPAGVLEDAALAVGRGGPAGFAVAGRAVMRIVQRRGPR